MRILFIATHCLYHFCLLCCTWKAFEKSSGVIIWLLTRKDGFLCMLHIWQSLFPILNIDVSKIFSDPFLILISCLPISKNLFFCVQPTMGAGMSVELQIEKCCNCKMQHSSSLGIHNFSTQTNSNSSLSPLTMRTEFTAMQMHRIQHFLSH